jgi:hypothetical protein
VARRNSFTGFEFGDLLTEPSLTFTSGTPALESTTVRSGNYAMKIDLTSAGCQAQLIGAAASAVPLYYRLYVYFTAFPTSTNTQVMGRTSGHRVVVNSSGQLGLFFNSNTANQLGSFSSALSLNTWYRVEMMSNINTTGGAADSGELQINGVSIATDSGTDRGSTASLNFLVGDTAANGLVFICDDYAVNDNAGTTSQITWPGEGRVLFLWPVADSSRVGWTGGASGTTNLYDALNNRPPGGVAAASATDLSQVVDGNSNTTDTYDATLAAYTDSVASGGAGMQVNDVVRVVMGVARLSNSSTTARNIGWKLVSNPATSEQVTGSGTTAASTEHTGWSTSTSFTVYVQDPTVALGTKPVMELRKATATTDKITCDLLGLYIDYAPALVNPLHKRASSPAQNPVAPTGGTF